MTSLEFDPRAERSPVFADLVRRHNEFWLTAPADLKAALLAGCEIEYGSELTPAGLRMTVRTKNRIGVVREPNGRTTVYEQR
jgi:hypothetical protein